jgi:hypothetical protein
MCSIVRSVWRHWASRMRNPFPIHLSQLRFTSTLFARTSTRQPAGRRDEYRQTFQSSEADAQRRAAHAQAALKPAARSQRGGVRAAGRSAPVQGVETLRQARTPIRSGDRSLHPMLDARTAQAAAQIRGNPLRSLGVTIAQAMPPQTQYDAWAVESLRAATTEWLHQALAAAQCAAGLFPIDVAVLQGELQQRIAALLQACVQASAERQGGAPPAPPAHDMIAAQAARLAEQCTQAVQSAWSMQERGVFDMEAAIVRAAFAVQRVPSTGAPPAAAVLALRDMVHGGLERADACGRQGIPAQEWDAVCARLSNTLREQRRSGALTVTDRELGALERMIAGAGLSDAQIAYETGLDQAAVHVLRMRELSPLLHAFELALEREHVLLDRLDGHVRGAGRAQRRLAAAAQQTLLGEQPQASTRTGVDADRLSVVVSAVRHGVFTERPGLMRGEPERPRQPIDARHPQRDLIACGLASIGLEGGDPGPLQDALHRFEPALRIAQAWAAPGWGSAPVPAQEERLWALLHAMSVHPVALDAALGPAGSCDRRRCEDLRVYLQASRCLAEEQGRPFLPPAEALALARARPSLPGKALQVAAARLAGEDPSTLADSWAMNALRNGFTSDAPGSAFARQQARLERMGHWMDVATRQSRWSRWNPARASSPLEALRRGYAGADLAPAEEKIRRYDCALRSAIEEGQGVLGRLLDRSEHSGWRLRQSVSWPPQQWAALTARHLALVSWLKAVQDDHPQGYVLDPAALDRLGQGHDGWTRQALAELGGVVMTEDVLREWMAQTRSVCCPAVPEGEWAPVDQALHRAAVIVQGVQVPALTQQDIGRAIDDLVGELRLGTRLRMVSGRVYGLGTKALSATLLRVLTGVGLRLRLDLRVETGKHAALEIAHPTHAFEVFVGTQTVRSAHVGGGAGVVGNVGLMRVGAMADAVLVGVDRRDVSGVVLRLPRREHTETENRAEFARILKTLLDHPAPGDASGRIPVLQRLLQEHPALSVTVVGVNSERRSRSSASAEGSVRAGLGEWRVGGAAGATFEATPSYRWEINDRSGALRVESVLEGRGSRTTVDARGLGNPTVQPNDSVRYGLGSAEAKQAADIRTTGERYRNRLTFEDGRLMLAGCTRDVEHESPQHFAESVHADLERWMPTTASRTGLDRFDDPESRARAEAEIRRYTEEAIAQYNGNQYFVERLRLREDAGRQIDAHLAFIRLAASSGSPALQARAMDSKIAVEALLADRSSWGGRSLRVFERGTDLGGPQASYFGLAGHQEGVDAIHVERELR